MFDVYALQRNIILGCGTSGRQPLKWMPGMIWIRVVILPDGMAGYDGIGTDRTTMYVRS